MSDVEPRIPNPQSRPFSWWDFECRDRDGNLKWAERHVPNMLHDEGEQFILQVTFSEAQSVPANYYIGLDARSSLAEADNLAALSGEPSGNGYARQPVASDATDFTIAQVGDDYRATTKTVTFTCATAAWSAVTKAWLCTVVSGTSGKLICSAALSASRTLQVGDSLNVSMYISLGEAA
jgi:hypothetical protein